MAKLTWEQLDACRSADEVAELLRANEIKGNRCKTASCPLAVATGWEHIGTTIAFPTYGDYFNGIVSRAHWLTKAENEFVYELDLNKQYQDLLIIGEIDS